MHWPERLMSEDGLEQNYKNWDLADDVPPVVTLGVVPRQPVVEEVVKEGRASLLAEPGTKSSLDQDPKSGNEANINPDWDIAGYDPTKKLEL